MYPQKMADQIDRQWHQVGLHPLPEPRRLLSAMQAGFPNSSDVALGVDRLIMLAQGASSVAGVMAFSFDRA